MSISRRLYTILGVMVLLISAELSALWFTINTLSSVRAYVGGEGLWSKAEKDAAFELEAYGRTHNERDYRAYLNYLSVPVGDRKARLEMAKPDPDYDAEWEGLLQGRNQPSDIPGMISLFRNFSQVSYIADAISDWQQGDAEMVALQQLGSDLHEEVVAHESQATIDRTLRKLEDIDQRLTAIEDHFSFTLGEGSRWLTGIVLSILVGAALTVELSGLLLTASVTRGISRRLTSMLEATDRISKGEFDIAIERGSKDELGRLADALNRMTGDLAAERSRAETALLTAEEALREAQRVAHVGSWEWDVQRDRVTCSKELLRLCASTADDFAPTYAGFVALFHPSDHEALDSAIRSAVEMSDPFTVDCRIGPLPSGERWLCVQGHVEQDASGAPSRVFGTALDITDRKLSEERLEFLAQHDPLTGLPNRALLMDRLAQATALVQRNRSTGALLFLDLDNFKAFNDTLGHGTGDRLLVAVGERLKAHVREVDTVARSGGDEFMIVLGDVSTPDGATTVARNIVNALEHPFDVDGHEMFVTASIGIIVFPDDGLDVETLIRDADTAMYQAKRHGRNKFQFYSPHMHDQAVRTLSLQNELRRGLERKEFVLHYQPMVELSSESIIAAEALVRWMHPDAGLRLPGEFIGAAEESGLIVPLGEWVLREACAQCRRWRDNGFDSIRVTVNVSPMQLSQIDFPATVASALRDAGIDAAALDLEITETALFAEPDRASSVLDELHRIGVGILLDDFGTGYSSLNYVKRMPIDALKIDRSFVKDIAEDPFDKAIAESIVALCESVGLRAIAEGVETRAQLDLLRNLGCDEIQGFCFSGAVDPRRFEELMRFWKRTGQTDQRNAAQAGG
ncbi:MAG TPA: EAL domain-containing protein [Candidatus Eremiobacteraceae bacterium]|nr:EAL domain-containing protein [Candidatus Eremiobacteraceae bacterium]